MTSSARLPRVILVEDDAAIRHFVALAVEDLPLQLLSCPTVHSAREALRLTGNDLALVLLDMMLPDGSGLDLLRDPQRSQWGRTARWVVFSAGMSRETREQIHEWGVELVLEKPVSLEQLLLQVEQACAAWRESVRRTSDSCSENNGSLCKPVADVGSGLREPSTGVINPEEPPAVSPLSENESLALNEYFFGKRHLFDSMKTQTLQRLPDEIARMERVMAESDAEELRRLAHNVKSVARMLGQYRASELASSLEDTSHRGQFRECQQLWNSLRSELERWLGEHLTLPGDPSAGA